MLAQVLRSYGETASFELVDVPKPALTPGHVLIRIAAAGVNPVDTKIRRLGPPFAPELPAVLGADLAGTIEEVGTGVTTFQRGDEVFGCVGGVRGQGGTLAEYIVADVRLIARKPRSLSMREAAALPLVSITAWESLYDRADVQTGQNVLIHAGTGGVGHVGVQLARLRGANVATTVSSDAKADMVRQLGANEIINYRQEQIDAYVSRLTGGKGFDVVFDTVGGANLDGSFQAARRNGTVVCINTRSTHDLSAMHMKGLTLHAVFMLIPMIYNIEREHHGWILEQVARFADEGKLKPLLDDQRFTLREAMAAHKHLETGQAVGKVVIDITE